MVCGSAVEHNSTVFSLPQKFLTKLKRISRMANTPSIVCAQSHFFCHVPSATLFMKRTCN
ncbi:hypothetical protein DPMN_071843 [Dreissena polymorpha]|uniref:Uncharacterized protein n=1 Tax=Dreissena polymorpha TaxID=45954 RepID=A0A9D3Z5A7_DREPO|nr:hypothetical protein DPMN_071843 [Dreissena polymorpha]